MKLLPYLPLLHEAMSESGDWLTPKVNGIFRFDKPPLIYWLMRFFLFITKKRDLGYFWDTISKTPFSFGIIIFNVDDRRYLVLLATKG